MVPASEIHFLRSPQIVFFLARKSSMPLEVNSYSIYPHQEELEEIRQKIKQNVRLTFFLHPK